MGDAGELSVGVALQWLTRTRVRFLPPVSGFRAVVAQLIEHRVAIAKVVSLRLICRSSF